MKTVVVLAMHGAPPRDFPREEMQEYFQLQAREHQRPPADGHPPRFKELEAKMRAFPRNETNDPFWQGSRELAAALEKASGLPVLLGFNEFCAPSLDEIFDRAAGQGAKKIVVVTPMMTRGGEHAEGDIPAAIGRARQRHPGLPILYAWPLDPADVAGFLVKIIKEVAKE
jgi:sirohydrochlorin cobaltochelatase